MRRASAGVPEVNRTLQLRVRWLSRFARPACRSVFPSVFRGRLVLSQIRRLKVEGLWSLSQVGGCRGVGTCASEIWVLQVCRNRRTSYGENE